MSMSSLLFTALLTLGQSSTSNADVRELAKLPLLARCDLVRRIVAYIPLSEVEGELSVPLAASSCARSAYMDAQLVIDAVVEMDERGKNTNSEIRLFQPGEQCGDMGFRSLGTVLANRVTPSRDYVRIVFEPLSNKELVAFWMNVGKTEGKGTSSCGETVGVAKREVGGWTITPPQAARSSQSSKDEIGKTGRTKAKGQR